MDKKMSTDDLKQHMKATKGILDENVSIDSVIDNDGTRSLHENKNMEKQSEKKQDKALEDFKFRSI